MAAGKAIGVPNSPERSLLDNDEGTKISCAASFDNGYACILSSEGLKS